MSNRRAKQVAVIGSFKQHYEIVLSAINLFRSRNIIVTSPAGTEVIDPDIDFVRFNSDDPSMSDAEVQSSTLINIFSADAVYVIAPEGYVGRTTCYEIGRLVQARRPLYFSAAPVDLPIHVPSDYIRSPEEVADLLTGHDQPTWLFHSGEGVGYNLERRLVDEQNP